MCNSMDALREHWNKCYRQTTYGRLLRILEEDRLNSIFILIYLKIATILNFARYHEKRPHANFWPKMSNFTKSQCLISTKPSKLCILTSFAPNSISKLQKYTKDVHQTNCSFRHCFIHIQISVIKENFLKLFLQEFVAQGPVFLTKQKRSLCDCPFSSCELIFLGSDVHF